MSVNPELAQGVIKVGDGRGFIIEANENRLVVTAAHCLPSFPPPAAIVGYDERTYQNLLGVIDGEPSVWCELLFADPVSDIAVLGQPDNQALYDQADAYVSLVWDAFELAVSEPADRGRAWLLGLDGEWGQCIVIHAGQGSLWIEGAANGIVGGMSGSPILNDEGAAIGVLGTSSGSVDDLHTEGGPEASLRHKLPGWLLFECGF